VAAISAGGAHTCAVTSAGKLECWGWNGDGELGDGTTTIRLTPVSMVGF
jgi:alpha-tubulin suppressor-like RCC1 family protein